MNGVGGNDSMEPIILMENEKKRVECKNQERNSNRSFALTCCFYLNSNFKFDFQNWIGTVNEHENVGMFSILCQNFCGRATLAF